MSDNDDGMLLNFSIPTSNIVSSLSTTTKNGKKSSIKVKGGRWADRRKTQLELMGRTNKSKNSKSNSSSVSVSGANDTPIIPRVKRTIDNENNDENDSSIKKLKIDLNTDSSNSIISSLFTANPEIQKRDYDKKIDESKLTPSNAPILDDPNLDFKNLGLHENLIKCLKDLKYLKPTKIQRMVIPKLLSLNIKRTRTNPFPPQPRDIFMQAQTGSGKTMAFTLPILNMLLSSNGKINRQSGIFALILTPTRELAQQIYTFIEDNLCKKSCNWIVPGIVIGGEKKKSEKARLRKGINILVATPGRLVDHIENTQSLDLSKIRYLILDEGDRLIELGFEDSISKIINKLQKDYKDNDSLGPLLDVLPPRRVNILCSATLKGNVKKLGDLTLNNPEIISANSIQGIEDLDYHMKAPDQLIQEIVVVPPKLRFTTLSGALMNFSNKNNENNENNENGNSNFTKTIVFLSCSHSVDFHFIALTKDGKRLRIDRERMEVLKKLKLKRDKEKERDKKNGKERKGVKDNKKDDKAKKNDNNDDENENDAKENDDNDDDEEGLLGSITAMTSPSISSNTIIYKLHGSLSQQTRTATLNQFSNDNSHNTILLCTDVASRGLDLPAIDYIIEYDPPFCIADHLHRVGRTARLGKKGLSLLFLMPGNEEKYIEKISPMHGNNLKFITYEEILTKAFAYNGRGNSKDNNENDENDEKKRKGNKFDREGSWDMYATTYQLNLEKWLLENNRALEIATDAFISHIRAYATHLSSERDCFNVKQIHLGHLAKAFGLREAPKKLASNSNVAGDESKKKESAKNKMFRLARLAVKSQNDEFNFA
ncbi:ATP-dependent RNA helicase dbp7 [Pichia californica]|uniref:ATP-dependent RNA helicase n=1 Tax=Pichia californica TaxID=460514 RepID=A0A9P6WNG4_9ASCO|nr:ATP-dependent RNA helicase dbp7 [[Candida] californica]KAG0689317.1 ATP-dependent RNA helicase dbp7 [[Candida] californica]